MKINVINSNKVNVMKIKSIVDKFTMNIGEDVYFNVFTKLTVELVNEIEEVDTKKIYIIDVEVASSFGGIEIAKLIREKDFDSEIIFVTNHDKMFEVVHRSIVNVFVFIEYFNDMENRLYSALSNIFKRVYDKKCFIYKTKNSYINIFYSAILYLYKDTESRKVLIVTKNKEYSVNMSLNEMSKLLDNRFIQVHRSCIVNMDRVHEYNFPHGYFVTDNSDVVNLCSKSHEAMILSSISC